MKFYGKDIVLNELNSGILYSFIVMTDDEEVNLYETPNEIVINSEDCPDREEYKRACIEFVNKHNHFLGNGRSI